MTPGAIQTAAFLGLLVAGAWPLGILIARIADGSFPSRGWPLVRLERTLYSLAGVDPDCEMSWRDYALALVTFSILGTVAVYAIQRLQGWLPLNPRGLGAVPPDLAFDTAVSFVTNTNWQSYGGETTLGHLTQMAALTVQNFVSAASGIAVCLALLRGFSRKLCRTVGNFWVDLTRVTLHLLLPPSVVLALVLVSQGVVQTLAPDATASLLRQPGGRAVATQRIALGPAASQVAIKQLGTNGGGFFNANGCHPFECPTALASFMSLLAVLIVPAALCFTFGRFVGDLRQGAAVLAAMLVLFLPALLVCQVAEQRGNPALTALGVDQRPTPQQDGGNMEGKEVRFGIAGSALWVTVTTAASCGAVNCMHDSLTPIGGLVPLVLMQLGEVVFGGVGSGLATMLAFAVIAVFVAGLMVGRTAEYLGKKIEAFEMKMACLVVLVPAAAVLVGTAVAVSLPGARSATANPGAHGFSEILYAFTSASNNNGSAFAGLSTNTLFYNVALAVAMFLGRFWVAVPILAMAGSLAAKKQVPPGPGTLPTHTPLFVAMLVGVIVIVGALTFFPALALGPVVEQLKLGA